MKWRILYQTRTKVGPFFIGRSLDGRFHAIFQDESLGSYDEAWQAAEDLAFGAVHSTSPPVDTSKLGIPVELGDWERCG